MMKNTLRKFHANGGYPSLHVTQLNNLTPIAMHSFSLVILERVYNRTWNFFQDSFEDGRGN